MCVTIMIIVLASEYHYCGVRDEDGNRQEALKPKMLFNPLILRTFQVSGDTVMLLHYNVMQQLIHIL